ncbi:MAG TPA: thioesterase family protein [Vicinamibacteria bacterium]|nr:thioesterase family protein [Vicinamibacteria bacterium]
MKERDRLNADFPVVIESSVAWGDMDAMGHVNNTVFFRYFESARIAYLERIGFLEEMKRSGIGPILASTSCNFRKPLVYPDTVWTGARADTIGEDRFVMRYRIVSESRQRVVADGEGLVVAYDYQNLKKAVLPDSVRGRIERMEQTIGP